MKDTVIGTPVLYFLDPGKTVNDQKYLEILEDKLEIHIHIHGCNTFLRDEATSF